MKCYKCGDREAANRRGLCNRCHAKYFKRNRNRKIVEIARSKPCMDCKEKHPHYVMEFDHIPERGNKLFGINSSSMHMSRTKLETEITKCDVICANCHKKRTYMRRLNK